MENKLSVKGLMLQVYGKEKTDERLKEMAIVLQEGINKHQDIMQEKVNEEFKLTVGKRVQSITVLSLRFSLMVDEYLKDLPYIEQVDFTEENIDRVLEISMNNQIRHYVINRFRNKVFYTIFVDYMNLRNPEITEKINLKQMYAHIVFSEDVGDVVIEQNYRKLSISILDYEGFLSAVFDESEDTLLF